MKRLVPVVALAAAAVLVGGVALARSGDDLPQVQLAEVVRADVAEVVEAPGNVTARASATLTSPADAVVEAVLVQDGESVTAGQVLVRLASPSAQERLRAAETAAANAAAARVDVPRAAVTAAWACARCAPPTAFSADSRLPAPASADRIASRAAAEDCAYRCSASATWRSAAARCSGSGSCAAAA